MGFGRGWRALTGVEFFGDSGDCFFDRVGLGRLISSGNG